MTRMSMQGSIFWMAPEVARGKGYSAKVDIWSTGCLVLEMLTGNVPWHKVRGNVIYLLGTGNAPPIPSNLTELSTSFLNSTFTIDPEKRPTASELLDQTFTDIDPQSVDFQHWSQTAMQQKADGGSTSEDISPITEGDETDEESESGSETFDDLANFNNFDNLNISDATFSGAADLTTATKAEPPKIQQIEDEDSQDDDDFLYKWTQSLRPEEARNLHELLNLDKHLK